MIDISKNFKEKNPTILEIGVKKGGSLEMWNHYFDNECTIYGIDKYKSSEIVPGILEVDNIHIYIGLQQDRDFWDRFKKETPKFDIVIDDGGHRMNHQIVTLECIYDRIKDDGVYLCEDVHTSYWKSHGGGLKKPSSFIEYTKNLIDELNAYHVRENDDPYDKQKGDLTFRQTTNSIHYYDSIVVLEKELDLDKPCCSIR